MDKRSSTPPVIPQEWKDFAKALAEVANKFKVRTFHMTFEGRDVWKSDRRFHGEASIHFRSVDARGRPSEGLTVGTECSLLEVINDEPKSSS